MRLPQLVKVSVKPPRVASTHPLPSLCGADACRSRIDSPCPAPRGGRPPPDRGREMESDVEH
jgi:hypothetical protein